MKAKPGVRFSDQSDEFRMFIRHAVGNFGCQIESYANWKDDHAET